jgi:hypothetical protein
MKLHNLSLVALLHCASVFGADTTSTAVALFPSGIQYTALAEVTFPEENLELILDGGEDPKSLMKSYSVQYKSIGEKFFCEVKKVNGYELNHASTLAGYDGQSFYTSYQPSRLFTSISKSAAQKNFTWVFGAEELLTFPFAAADTVLSPKKTDPGHRSEKDFLKALTELRSLATIDGTKVKLERIVDGSTSWGLEFDQDNLYPKNCIFRTNSEDRLRFSVETWGQIIMGVKLPKSIKMDTVIAGRVVKSVNYSIKEIRFGLDDKSIPKAPLQTFKEVVDLDALR